MARRALVLLLFLAALPARADEGMWTFDQVPRAEIASRLGVTLTDEWIENVRLATVRVGFGCTGSLVSQDGLVLTNQHCAQGALAEHSARGRDLLAHGFIARTPADELRCPTYHVDVLIGIEDVTAQVEKATAGLGEGRAHEMRNQTLTRLEKAAEDAARTDASGPLHVESVTLYEGGRYCLYRYKRYDDVRLAFAPEMAIAQFGGDPDNFQFPRWNLDMALMRVYENGRPAHTPHFLRMNFAGPRTGDAVFVAGNPGGTDRLLTSEQLRTLRETALPLRLLLATELRGRLSEYARAGAEQWRIAQDPIADVENAIKVLRGELAALLDDAPFAARRRAEEDFLGRASDDTARAALTAAFAEIGGAEEVARAEFARRFFLESPRGIGSDLFRHARTLVRGTAERTRPNESRLREYNETALPRVARTLLAPVPIEPDLERLRLSFWLERMREWLGPDDPAVRRLLGRDAPDSLAARLVRGTQLGDPAFRKRLWDGGRAAVTASKDPMIAFMRRLDPDARAARMRFEDTVEAPETAASERIARARFQAYGTRLYPDATGTLRLNFGRVQGWREKGAAVPPFTTLRTLYGRATGSDPFALPPSWIEARGKLNLDTPFNLCTTNDIVGGNSGSPMIDPRGDLVGLVFDGNIHSISGSYWFDAERNRTIALHPAAIREALAKVYGATALLKELGGEMRAAR